MRSQLASSGPPTTTPVWRHRPDMPHVQSTRTARKDKPCHTVPQNKNNPESKLTGNENDPHANPDQQSSKKIMQKGIMNWILRPHGNLQLPRQRHNNKLTKLLTEAVQDQNKIGWNNFMKGRMSQKWGEAQQVHCLEKQKTMQTEKGKWEAKHNTGELF